MKFSRTLPYAMAVCLTIAPLTSFAQFSTGPATPASGGAQGGRPAGGGPGNGGPGGGGPGGFGGGGFDPSQLFNAGGNIAPAWSTFKYNKKKKIRLNFKNSTADSVLAFLSNASGITILKDPSFKDLITISTAKEVTIDEAFSIFNTYVGLKNFTLGKSDSILVLRPRDGANSGFDWRSMMGQMGNNPFGQDQGNQSELRVYPIRYANAAQIARILNDVFAPIPGQQNQQQQGNRGGFGGFGGRFGGGGNGNVTIQIPGVTDANQQNGQNRAPQVKASSDDFSNSVIVNAPPRDQEQVATILAKIDKQTEQPIEPHVYHLKYAVASDIAPAIQNVLVATAPKGVGGVGNTSTPAGQQFGAAARFGGNASAAFGNVVADARTNSLVVSATKDNQASIVKLIDDLDKPVTILDTTSVFQLKNAKADTVAQLIQDAFGNRQGVSGSGYNYTNTTTTTPKATSTLTNRQGSQTTSTGADNLGDPNIPDNASATTDPTAEALALALQDPTTDSGQILTSVGVQGFGGGGGGGGGFFQRAIGATQGGNSGQSLAGSGVSRGADGIITPTHDLAGQVTVIPDINTNSIIVVTPPEFKDAVYKILESLDKIPEQVVIETLVVETNLDSTNQFGVEWSAAQNKIFGNSGGNAQATQNFGLQSTTPALQGFSYTLTGGSISAFLNLLKTDVKYDVISTPRIFTSNNQTAEINVSQKVPYLVSTVFNANNEPSYTYGYENVGVVLTVTPRISANGYVTLDVDQQDNDLQSYTSFNAPIINQREANTTVSVQDGKTLVLGGIIRNTVSATIHKVPLLGDLPILGNLFKNSNVEKVRTELLVFLTPHIVHSPTEAEAYDKKATKELSKGAQESIEQILHLSKMPQATPAAPATPMPAPVNQTKGTNS